jgi:HprK-related kinase A
LIVAEIGTSEIVARLRTHGLRLRTGPVVTNLSSGLASVARGIALHYAHHEIDNDDGFADFHVSVDRRVTVRNWLHPQAVFRLDDVEPFTPQPVDNGFALLECGLNWCVASHCHQYLMLEAAVLKRNGHAMILPAPSGAGKSTLCAALVHRGGWRLVSDEVALIEPASGRLVPLPRPIGLQNESIELTQSFAPGAPVGDVVVDKTTRRRIAHVRPPADNVSNVQDRPLAAWVVMPKYRSGAATELVAASRAHTFMTLIENAFNYEVHARKGFATLADLIDRSACFSFVYGGDLQDAVSVFDRLAAASRA